MTQFYKEGQLLQWVKSDKIGAVEEILEIDTEWTKFNSGSRIASNLISEFMIPIEGEPLNVDDIINTYDTGASVPIPQDNNITIKTEQIVGNEQKKINPIKILFDKQKKTESINLNLNFSINVPSKDIFDIINTTFEESEVVDELTLFILNQVNSNKIKSTLDESIKSLILNKYKS